ncbi:MAG: hypothetical protein H6Q14_1675 [Bacteroidetes bacterium]|nr:hypothetical protein [Bacteroidota bacterium]
MKTLNNIIVVLSVALLAVSCTKDYETPPFTEPSYVAPTDKLISVEAFRTMFASATTSPTVIEDTLFIQARVVGNDVSGNIYKQIYLQDATGGIVVGVDQSSIYAYYKVGQEVFLELQGLSVLTYGGELQIGYKGTSSSRIPWDTFTAHAHLNSWPDLSQVDTAEVSLADLTASMKNTLVELDSVYFVNEGSEQFAVASSGSAVSQTLKDKDGNSIDVRTSVYADFSTDSLPVGYGKIVGVLSKYNGSWQLSVRSRDDIKTFSGEMAVFLDETLLTQDSFNKFTAYSVTGTQAWGVSTSYGAMITGYLSGTNYANEDWLISPASDLSTKTSVSLSFYHASGPTASLYVGKDSGYYTVWVSNDYTSGDPSTATWTQLTPLTYGTAAWTYVASTFSIPEANLKSNFRFAFKYMSSATQSATWEIKNVSLK